MRVVVIGGGVIGVTSAYFLARAGHSVTLVERQPELAAECSFANGGQISAGHAVPWSSPAAPGQALRWVGRRNAPFALRLTADPAQWRWGLAFLRQCAPQQYRRNAKALLAMAHRSRVAFDRLLTDSGIAWQDSRTGILTIYRSRSALDAAIADLDLLHASGFQPEICDHERCRAVEPALPLDGQAIAGGIYIRDDRSGDAHSFSLALADACRDRGVAIVRGTEARLVIQNGRVVAVAGGGGEWRCDAVVLAAGVDSRILAAQAGIRLPIWPIKGYSVTVPIADERAAPRVSITDEARRVVISRLGSNLRAAGIAELGRNDSAIEPHRAQPVLDALGALFPRAVGDGAPSFWACLRPMTPDAQPLVGATRVRGLYVNTGHGHLGWTLAAASGESLASRLTTG